MKLTAQAKLITNATQKDALKATMRAANAVCDSISAFAWEHKRFGQFPLHNSQYAVQRAESGLTAQVVVRCVSKVADAYKLDRRTMRTFLPLGAIAYDDRILTWYTDKGEVSIWTVGGRMKLAFDCGDYQRGLLAFRQGEADLAFVGGEFYLMATVSIPDPPLIETDGVIGVDLGIVSIATDSAGNTYSGEPVKSVRRRMRRIRALLQSKGTKNAKGHLRKARRKQSRFTKHTNHVISKALVKAALLSQKALALEDLSGIRERANGFSREMRWQVGNWAFDQLAQMVAYKAQRAGVPVVLVAPRNTSRTCSVCGYCDKANRKSQSQFLCLSCGLQLNADVNASINIAQKAMVSIAAKARGVVNRPIDAPA